MNDQAPFALKDSRRTIVGARYKNASARARMYVCMACHTPPPPNPSSALPCTARSCSDTALGWLGLPPPPQFVEVRVLEPPHVTVMRTRVRASCAGVLNKGGGGGRPGMASRTWVPTQKFEIEKLPPNISQQSQRFRGSEKNQPAPKAAENRSVTINSQNSEGIRE